MSLETNNIEFEGFLLDLKEKALLRNGERLPINPKTFQLLTVLVENHGRLVEKERLMESLWADSVVEDANLAFTVSLLRKALGDDAQKPRFVETVPRRGYRFVAAVTEGLATELPQNGAAAKAPRALGQMPARSRLRGLVLPVLVILSFSGIGLWYARSSSLEGGPPILSAPFSSENLSTNSRVLAAVISPDGKTVAYTNGLRNEKQSIWLRQLDSSNNIQIVPPSDAFYYDLAFSPDGNSLYFVRGARPATPGNQYTIYRIPSFGGVASRIVDEVQGDMSVSPDGRMISFVRCYFNEAEWCSLWIVDIEGKNERKLVSRPSPFRIGDNVISPDGRSIAFGVGQSRNGANDFGLSIVEIESGVEKELTKEKFFDIKSQSWLPDQRGMLITALKLPDKQVRIWEVSAISGETKVLTKDSEDYSGLSLDRGASMLVATQRRPDFHLNLYRIADLTKAKQVFADAATVTFGPDKKLIVASGRPGNIDLWSMDQEGGEARQLTNSSLDDLGAAVSPDGSTIYFASNRTVETHVWRMRADGSDQTQLTTGEGGFPLAVSPEGKWLYYHSGLGRTLKRVSVSDGKEELLVDKLMPVFAVSPDCSQAAFVERNNNEIMLTVVSLPDGQALGSFRLAPEMSQASAIAWSNDGKSLFYVTPGRVDESNTLWVQPIVGQTTPRKIADLPNDGLRNEYSFAVSPDGETFAVIQGNWKRDAVLFRGLKH